jgi:hypothetical protein
MLAKPARRLTTVVAVSLWLATAAQGAVVTVTGTGDTLAVDGAVTLREAIASTNAGANANADVVAVGAYGPVDTIAFAIPGAGPHTITLGATPLPVIVRPVIVAGYTQPGSSANTLAVGDNAVLNVILRGTAIGVHGLEVGPGGGTSVITGLVLQGHFFAIQINDSNVVVNGNFIGTDRGGTMADATTGNGRGVSVNIGNIGNTTIGGSTPAERNVISGNGVGIVLNSQLANTVRGNYIGVSGTGTADLGNAGEGIYLGGIGVATLGGATLGGATATAGQGAGNVIAGNGAAGIRIETGGLPTVIGPVTIEGNILGLDANGVNALPNTGPNVSIRDTELPGDPGTPRLGPVTIGGSAVGAGNVISAGGHGIFNVAAGTVIRGNRIGTDLTGTVARPNTFGIEITGTNAFAGGATIGGTGAGEGNVISGNASDAVRVFLSTATLQGNRIGVTPGGAPLGNGGYGVFVDSGETVIGGTAPGAGNVIANNGDTGVQVRIGFPAVRNASNATILGNSITQNGLLGINNSVPDLVTANDAGDGDSGPNDLQNFPVIASATLGAGTVTLAGTLDSTATSDFRIELFSSPACDGLGAGEGATFLGAVDVSTDGSGQAAFGPLVLAIPAGQPVITATATNGADRTSELSTCVTASGGPPPLPTLAIDDVTDAEGDAGATAFTFTVTLSAPSATPVTVQYATAVGTAGAPADFASTSGMLTFTPGGSLSEQVVVNVVGETAVEADETFFVDLSSPSGATLAVSRGTGTILNDDSVAAPAEVPTLSQWALLLLAAGLALAGTRWLAQR